jgi:hypothetical protein
MDIFGALTKTVEFLLKKEPRPYLTIELTHDPGPAGWPPYLYLHNVGKAAALEVWIEPWMNPPHPAFSTTVTFEKIPVILPGIRIHVPTHSSSEWKSNDKINYLFGLTRGKDNAVLVIHFQSEGRRFIQEITMGAGGTHLGKVHSEPRWWLMRWRTGRRQAKLRAAILPVKILEADSGGKNKAA